MSIQPGEPACGPHGSLFKSIAGIAALQQYCLGVFPGKWQPVMVHPPPSIQADFFNVLSLQVHSPGLSPGQQTTARAVTFLKAGVVIIKNVYSSPNKISILRFF